MRHLEKPLSNIPAECIFQKCIASFRDRMLRSRLQHCTDLVKNDSKAYEACTLNDLTNFQSTLLPTDTTTNDLVSVYDTKFARAGAPGREYYDLILAQPIRGICPLCGVRPVATLDHYLPKTQYPSLAVTPMNLIPSCRDCNNDKNNYTAHHQEEALFHPYFDTISSERWLFAKLNTDCTVSYFTDCPPNWSDVHKARVQKHLNIYHLQYLYGIMAAERIAEEKLHWRNVQIGAGECGLLSHIQECKESAEAIEMNSWQAALFRGMESQFSIVLDWLDQSS